MGRLISKHNDTNQQPPTTMTTINKLTSENIRAIIDALAEHNGFNAEDAMLNSAVFTLLPRNMQMDIREQQTEACINGEMSSDFDLSNLTVKQLKEICKEKNWTGFSTLKRDELIEFIQSDGESQMEDTESPRRARKAMQDEQMTQCIETFGTRRFQNYDSLTRTQLTKVIKESDNGAGFMKGKRVVMNKLKKEALLTAMIDYRVDSSGKVTNPGYPESDEESEEEG